jgi:histidine ammonia-lyase
MAGSIALRPGRLDLPLLRRIARETERIALDPPCRSDVEAGAQTVADAVAHGDTVYGVNTGFGALARTLIPHAKLAELQRNLVLSHSTGTGPLLSDATVRLILVLKVASLARGFSGVRWEVISSLLRLLQKEVYPCIPSKGSVGASGDLAPLAHLAAALLGFGEVRCRDETLPATDGLARAGLEPLTLAPKEGLALLNGTQVSTALALQGLFAAEDAFAAAIVAGTLTIDAIRASDDIFDARVQAVRGQPGQMELAAVYRELLRDSAIRASHLECDRVQDPYSLRCQPQVMGACLDHLRFAAGVFEREANAVSDNPLVFSEQGDIVSGGNFHAEPVAMAADVLALPIAETGALAERRIAVLMDPGMSELPAFLVEDSGENSGFMMAQVTAAALASENKMLAHPASVDSLPTSANQEDHVSMATYAARRLSEMADNCAGIVGIELLAAAQGVEFHRPLKTSPTLEAVVAELRKRVARYDRDRFFAPDIAAAKAWVQSGYFRRLVPGFLPSDHGTS